MYGINKKAMFLTAKNNEAFEGQELVVQVAWPHIVGRVRRFGCTESQEELRQKWTESRGEDAMVVQSDTHRVYVELVGTLQDVRKDRIEEYAMVPIKEYVRETLEAMCQWIVSTLKEGQKYAFRWETEIVPDDFFQNMRKARKSRAEG